MSYTRSRLLQFLLCLAALAALAGLAFSCRAPRPAAEVGRIPDVVQATCKQATRPDSLKTQKTSVQGGEFASNLQAISRADFAPTPAGERRYVRALKAARPAYTAKRGAVLTVAAAGAAVRVNAATGKRAAAASDSAALVVAARGAQAALATDGATITQTPPARAGWFASLKAWLIPSMAAVGLAWVVFLVWRRRRNYPA